MRKSHLFFQNVTGVFLGLNTLVLASLVGVHFLGSSRAMAMGAVADQPLQVPGASTSQPLVDFFAQQTELVRLQTTQVNCVMTDLLLRAKLITDEQKRVYFFRPTANACATASPLNIRNGLFQAEQAKRDLQSKGIAFHGYPLFANYLEKVAATGDRATLERFGLTDYLYPVEGRFQKSSIFKRPMDLELQLRATLGVQVAAEKAADKGSMSAPKGQCQLSRDELVKMHHNISLEVQDYNQDYWSALLRLVGYDCTVSWYLQRSDQINKMSLEQGGSASASGITSASRPSSLGEPQSNTQNVYERNLREIRSQALVTQKSWIKGETLVVIPQLGYDIPDKPGDPEREKLDYHEMNRFLSALGARVVLIDRSTLADREEQIAETKRNLIRFLEKDQKNFASPKRPQKYYFLARSMGSMILREVLERNISLRKYVKAAVSVGGTPYGSVIAEFKARTDIFDEVFYKTSNVSREFFNDPLGTLYMAWKLLTDSQTRAFAEAIKYRSHYWSMSHFEFIPKRNDSIEFPVVNLILLPRSLQNYFNESSRIAGVDFTFLHMLMYGPTEGSSPLAHAAWDTKNSQRLFDHQYNHLSFWQWTEREAVDRWLAAIKSAREIYQLDAK